MSYHVYKEIVKLNDVIFKSKPIKIEDAKVKPKTSHSNTKISGNSSNPVLQKQQTYHQQHQPQYQQPAAHLPILQSSHQENSLLKSQRSYVSKGATKKCSNLWRYYTKGN